MNIIPVLLAIILIIVYTVKTDFSNPPSVAMWCVVMLLARAAILYGGVAYVLVK